MNQQQKCRQCGGGSLIKETYVQPITVSYPEWIQTITDSSVPRTDALFLNGTIGSGAVLRGHVRQNAMTAFYPYTPLKSAYNEDIPQWSA